MPRKEYIPTWRALYHQPAFLPSKISLTFAHERFTFSANKSADSTSAKDGKRGSPPKAHETDLQSNEKGSELMSANEEDEREETDIPFNDDQQQMFANENQATNATRPQVGTQDDPLIPGLPTSEEERGREK